jgi:hypothetical protein
MPRVKGWLRVIRRRDRWGRPVDPGYGVDEGAGIDGELPEEPEIDEGGEIDNSLPGNKPPGHPGHLPAWPGFPPRPGQGLPVWPGRPVDPGFGVDEGTAPGQGLPGRPVRPGHLPAWPVRPERPDLGLPPAPGNELPPVDPPPGTIWPPLPPGSVKPGKVLLLAWITGVGYRYVVIEVKPPSPDQGGPDAPPTAQPKRL